MSLTNLLSNHEVFWREHRLFVEVDLLRKLKQFPVNDPQVRQLAGSGGQSRNILYQLLVDHVNRGKTTKRLIPRVYEDQTTEG